MWRTRSIFISSTFVDMQEERDFLRTRSFLELEERLRARRCHLEWVDLRLGVATSATGEGARELQVLKVCLDEVRRCRPFLIILLGDRYGWVPPVESIGAAAREQGLPASVAGRSVTDLEIEFGVFGDPDQQTRSFFYIREPLPYAAMPPATAALYSDAHCDDADALKRVDRLATLKSRIEQTLPARVRRYQATWDPLKHRVTGLEALGQMVLADIWAELDAETASSATVEVSWQEAERQALDDFIEDRSRDFVGRQQTIAELERLATSAVGDRAIWGCCVEGVPGSGKSALFGVLCGRLRETGALVLAHSAGASIRSASVDAMLLRWIGELARTLGVETGVTETSSPNIIDAAFASLLGRVAERRRIVVIIDALDQFESTPRGRFATWLPSRWPPNARLVVTAIPGPESNALVERSLFGTLQLLALDAAETLSIARSICARYHRELDNDVYDALITKTGADGPAWGSPLWVTLAVEELNLLDADDFARAQRDYTGAPAARLRALMVDTIDAFPTDIPGLFARMFERAEDIFGTGFVRTFLGLIAVGRAGWRENDFRSMVPGLSGEDWDELRFASLRRLFRSQIRQRGTLLRWDVSHNQMRIAIQQHMARHGLTEASLHAAVVDHLLRCPEHDPLRVSETMVHLLGCGDVARAATYYTDNLTADEREGAMMALRDYVLQATDPAAAAAQIAALVDPPGLDPGRRIKAAQFHVFALGSLLESRAPLALRLTISERAANVLEAAAQREGADVITKLSFAAVENTIAAMQVLSGRSDHALPAFQRSIATAETINGNTLENNQRDYGLARSFEGVGDVDLAAGRLTGAEESFKKALSSREKMLAAEPENPEWNLSFSVALSKLGETQLIAARPAEALATFERFLATTRWLLSADPANAELRGKLANYYERTGTAHSQKGDDAAALEALHQCYEIRAALAAADPGNNDLQSALLAAVTGIGEILARHKPVEAINFYETALRISQKLLAVDPNNDVFLRGGLVAHFGIGKCLATMGMLEDAIKAFRRCIEVAERLTRFSPDNVIWQIDLADSLYRAALCGDYPKARLSSSLAILQRMNAQGKLTPISRKLKVRVEERLKDLSS